MFFFLCTDCLFFLLFLLLLACRPVGMPKLEKVYLHNPSSEQISLISISATTAHFHASFFQNRVSISGTSVTHAPHQHHHRCRFLSTFPFSDDNSLDSRTYRFLSGVFKSPANVYWHHCWINIWPEFDYFFWFFNFFWQIGVIETGNVLHVSCVWGGCRWFC